MGSADRHPPEEAGMDSVTKDKHQGEVCWLDKAPQLVAAEGKLTKQRHSTCPPLTRNILR